MNDSLDTWPIAQLLEQCRAENDRYRREKQADSRYCFELFRRALHLQSDAAWQAIMRQYHLLVTRWVHQYGKPDTDNIDGVVNEAFTRLWRYGSRQETAAQLDSLGKCLSYLKKCTWSTVEDTRRRNADSQNWLELESALHIEATSPSNPERKALQNDLGRRLRAVLRQTIQDEAERVVAEESWIYGKMPRQIQAEYPQLFPKTKDVSQTKRNMLKRLKRNPDVLAAFESFAGT